MSTLCIAAALSPEVQAIAEHYSLNKTADKGISLFANTDGSIVLVKTGVGKINTTAAMQNALRCAPTISAFLNVGIAGGIQPYGSTVLASSIVDATSGREQYPHLPPSSACKELGYAKLHTVENPSEQYKESVIFDMEASAFYEFATEHVDNSKIQAVKVISDNPENAISKLNPDSIKKLVIDALPKLDPIVNYLLSLESTSEKALNDFCENTYLKIHHSVTEQHRFKRLCQRCSVLTNLPPEKLSELQTDNVKSAAELAKRIQAKLDSLNTSYH